MEGTVQSLENDVTRLQDTEKLIVQYGTLQLVMKSTAENEQAALPEDVDLVNQNISDLNKERNWLLESIQFDIESLRNLHAELGFYK